MRKTKQRHCRCCKSTLVGKKQRLTGMCSNCIRKLKNRFGVVGVLVASIFYAIKLIANRKGESI